MAGTTWWLTTISPSDSVELRSSSGLVHLLMRMHMEYRS